MGVCYSLMHIDSQMMFVSHLDVRRGRRLERSSKGLRCLVLLAVSLLFGVSTVQVCHVHEGAGLRREGLPRLAAPADNCPLCVAPSAALAAEARTTATAVPGAGEVVLRAEMTPRATVWSFDLLSRPPPVMAGWCG